MGRKNSPSANKELNELIAQYETARAENRQLYLDGDQLADIADQYAAERKFNEAQEVITYGLHLHPDSTDLLVEQAYLYLDTGKIPLAKKVVESITDEYDTDVKMLKAELMLNEGQLENARNVLDTIEDADGYGIPRSRQRMAGQGCSPSWQKRRFHGGYGGLPHRYQPARSRINFLQSTD